MKRTLLVTGGSVDVSGGGFHIPRGAPPRRTIDITPASCFGPMIEIFALGHVNAKRVSYARPLIP